MTKRFMIMRKADRTTEEDARVTFSSGLPTVIDGPFAETEQLMAGYTMIDVDSKEAAIEWVKRRRAVDEDGEIEIREVGCPGGLVGFSPPSTPAPGSDPRFFVLLHANEALESGASPGDKLLAAMAQRNEESMKAGVMLAGEGLQPSSRGTRVKFSGGKVSVIDGPFTEAKELIAGFWLIQVKSKEEAIEWVKRYPYPLPDVVVEIRQIVDGGPDAEKDT
jgi:hypothetical protein